MARQASRAFSEEIPALLAEREISLRALAKKAGVDKAFLSRAARGKDAKRPSAAMCRKLAQALELPPDYFAEAREAEVIDRVRADPEFRDRIYRLLTRPED